MNLRISPLETLEPTMDKCDRLKVAFLGGGIDSAVGQVHRIAVELDRRFELVAGCFGPNIDVNRSSAQQYGVLQSRTYEDLSGLLKSESENLDTIVVVTPTPRHKEDVVTCLNAGVPVVCEKALAASRDEACEIRDALKEQNGFLAVIYNYTGYPMLRELRHMIQQGRLGRIEQVHIEMPQEGFARLDSEGNHAQPQEWRLHDGDLPTIALDLGVHLHHAIRFLTGEKPVSVVAMNNSFGSFRSVVDNTVCLARLSNDITCNIWYSKAALGHRNGFRVRVYGEEGSAEWYQLEPEVLYYHDNRGNRAVLDRSVHGVAVASLQRYDRFKVGHPAGFIEAFANLYCDIADSLSHYLKTGHTMANDYVFGMDEALEGLNMLTAMTESSKSESWVFL